MIKSLVYRVKYSISQDKDFAKKIKNIFGFFPENVFLYKQAFRHKSIAKDNKKNHQNNNERLEYLGDAILSSIIAEYLFKRFPYKDEGFLTEMRSKIVSRSNLNSLSIKLGIDKLIISFNENGFKSRSINGDAFEAFIGAMYLDKGYDFTKKIIIKRIIKCHIDIEDLEKKEFNFKSKIIEWTQKEKKLVEFNIISETIFNNNKLYEVEVLIDGISFGKGTDYSIKRAEQIAAEEACNKIS